MGNILALPCVIAGMKLQVIVHVAAIHRYRAWRLPIVTNMALALHRSGGNEKRKTHANRDENEHGKVEAEGEESFHVIKI